MRRNMAVNCSLTRLNISWMAVVLPRNVALILRPLGGMSHTCMMSTDCVSGGLVVRSSLVTLLCFGAAGGFA